MIYKNIGQLIGNTPIIELVNIEKELKLKSRLFGKLEYFNPAGSIKDRVAKKLIDVALKEKKINKDTLIIEPTSGNTGIGIASICSSYNLKFIAVMPESMSIERRKLIAAYGGEVVLTPAKDGMKGAIDLANKMAKDNPNSFIPSQFDNINNYLAHYETTAKEIYSQMDGKIDYFLAGVGTGGTITGVGKYLKEKNKDIKIIAIEPFSSPYLSKKEKGSHKIQGIGAGFIPKILDTSIYDSIMTIKDTEAYSQARLVGKKEGFLIGISSGAILTAGIKIAQKTTNKNIVMVFPDNGERYLSSDLYDE